MTREAEAVEFAVVSRDVDAAISQRQAAKVVKRGNLVAAGVEFFTGFGVQRVEHDVGGVLDAFRAIVMEAAVRVGLLSIFAASVGVDNSVSN